MTLFEHILPWFHFSICLALATPTLLIHSCSAGTNEQTNRVGLDEAGGAEMVISKITIDPCASGEIPNLYLGEIILKTDTPRFFRIDKPNDPEPLPLNERVRVTHENGVGVFYTYRPNEVQVTYDLVDGEGELHIKVPNLADYSGLATGSLSIEHPAMFHFAQIRSSQWNKPWTYCSGWYANAKRAYINRDLSGLITKGLNNQDQRHILDNKKPGDWRIAVEFPEVCDSRIYRLVQESTFVSFKESASIYHSRQKLTDTETAQATYVDPIQNTVPTQYTVSDRTTDSKDTMDDEQGDHFTLYRAVGLQGGGVKQIRLTLRQMLADDFKTIFDATQDDQTHKQTRQLEFDSQCVPGASVTVHAASDS